MVDLKENIKELSILRDKLLQCRNDKDRIAVLSCDSLVQSLESPFVFQFLETATEKEKLILLSIVAIGQAPIIFHGLDGCENSEEAIKCLIKQLESVETFFDTIGGIVGYHITFLNLVEENSSSKQSLHTYSRPSGYSLETETPEVWQAIRWGIEGLPNISEMYPVGGAGDRLDLHDNLSGEPLPAAQLHFAGRTLLETLVRDLQAREYLYFKLFDKQLTTPVVVMTSEEKNNDHHIHAICEQQRWFGRPRTSFYLFSQPSVPVISEEGMWVMEEPLRIMLKPGGHGAIWKLAKKHNVYDWLCRKQGRKKILLRQINNPVGGTDYGIIAFIGLGCHHNKDFGFASCERLLNSPEGMNVLVSTQTNEGTEYAISNIEYTDFVKKGISDQPEKEGSPYSAFPSNTNILFVDVDTARRSVDLCPYPGLLINLKQKTVINGREVHIGRLELTMQNLADVITDKFKGPQNSIPPDKLRSFITYNERRKTLSVTKSMYVPRTSIQGTPEGSFYDLLHNHHTLLRESCNMVIPEWCSEEEYLQKGPSNMVLFHPALGPMYRMIGQKIQKGKLSYGAEMQLDIAELEITDLLLSGSLLICANSVMGQENSDGILEYGPNCGKCILKNVAVENAGIDRTIPQKYWENKLVRVESLQIYLEGNAEFYAENVTIKGNHTLRVPSGHRMVAHDNGFSIQIISSPTWYWKYSFDPQNRVIITKCLT